MHILHIKHPGTVNFAVSCGGKNQCCGAGVGTGAGAGGVKIS